MMLKTTLCIIMTIVCGLTMTSCEKIKKKTAENKTSQYMYNSDYVDLSPLISDLNQHKIFLIGETHGLQENSMIQKEFIMFLKENTQLKYVLMEISPATSYLYNQYLKTGDLTIIDPIFEKIKGTYAYTKEAYNFIKWLYGYNQTFDEDDRLQIIGVDIIHPYQDTGILVLQNILAHHQAPNAVQQEVDDLLDFQFISKSDPNMKKLLKITKALLDHLLKNTDLYKDIYEEDFIVLHSILLGIPRGIECYEADVYVGSNNLRDKTMYDIFKLQVPYGTEEKIFGQLGVGHTLTSNPTDDIKWFSSYLNTDQHYANQVISTKLYYDSATKLEKKDGQYTTITFSDFYPSDEMESHYTKTHVLYKLNEPDSIFTQNMVFDFAGIGIQNRALTDFIQYYILFNEASASHPLKP